MHKNNEVIEHVNLKVTVTVQFFLCRIHTHNFQIIIVSSEKSIHVIC